VSRNLDEKGRIGEVEKHKREGTLGEAVRGFPSSRMKKRGLKREKETETGKENSFLARLAKIRAMDGFVWQKYEGALGNFEPKSLSLSGR